MSEIDRIGVSAALRNMRRNQSTKQRKEITRLREELALFRKDRLYLTKKNDELREENARLMALVDKYVEENARLRDQVAGLTAAADSMHLDLMSDARREND